VITGGTSGIGEAIALLLAQEGAAVSITGRSRDRGEAVVSKIQQAGGTAKFIPADSRTSQDCRRVVDETQQGFGRLDILVNNAGVFYAHTILDCPESEWDEQLDSKLKGWGLVGGDRAVAYCAANGGVVLLTKAMAIDHGPQGIRVNCICPGDVLTPMLPADAKLRELKWEEYLAGCSNRPLGRIGTVGEIAQAALFLASDDSSFMTGATLVVDGGGTAD
jgi:NAD(P)-dependent dehydrogenase (short-subunit alcohol dehydrogenase family)